MVGTRERYPDGPLTRYAADLVVPTRTAAECALLKALAAHYVMRRPSAVDRLAAQRVLLAQLAEAVFTAAPEVLEPGLRASWDDADDSARLRTVIDQIAQLTDSSAVAWHRRLVSGPT